MQLTINLTPLQYNYLVTECNKLKLTKQEFIQKLLNIQIEIQKDCEGSMNVDLWDTIED